MFKWKRSPLLLQASEKCLLRSLKFEVLDLKRVLAALQETSILGLELILSDHAERSGGVDGSAYWLDCVYWQLVRPHFRIKPVAVNLDQGVFCCRRGASALLSDNCLNMR